MRQVILDMDPGIDDAAAIAVAVNHPELNVSLITTVAGNVSVDKTTKNALKLLEFFHREDIPVAAGASKPLKKAFADAANIHGESGMPGYDFPEPTIKPIDDDAVTAMHKVLQTSSQPVTLIATGAYTNVATLFQNYPFDLVNIDEVILKGGSVSGGNVSSVAEFNIFTDPDAAKIVMEAPVKKTMIGLDVTLKALITPETMAAITQMGKAGNMLSHIITAYGDVHEGGKPMHDVNTILYAVDPSCMTVKDGAVDVVTEGPAAGATVWDFQHRWHENDFVNATIGVDVDAERFNEWFLAQVQQMNA